MCESVAFGKDWINGVFGFVVREWGLVERFAAKIGSHLDPTIHAAIRFSLQPLFPDGENGEPIASAPES